jgi:hypothetical protein
MPSSVRARRVAALITTFALAILAAGPVAAHEAREVAGYSIEVGFIAEPVFVGDRSGLEFLVHKGDTGVEGLEKTVKAEVTKDGQTRQLELTAREGDPGAYESVFIPTVAGPYTFHLTGAIESNAIDESFTSSATGFDEVQESSAGQFPVQFPSEAQVVADVKAAKDASTQVTIALALGGLGLVVGVVALGVALASRRRQPAP